MLLEGDEPPFSQFGNNGENTKVLNIQFWKPVRRHIKLRFEISLLEQLHYNIGLSISLIFSILIGLQVFVVWALGGSSSFTNDILRFVIFGLLFTVFLRYFYLLRFGVSLSLFMLGVAASLISIIIGLAAWVLISIIFGLAAIAGGVGLATQAGTALLLIFLVATFISAGMVYH